MLFLGYSTFCPAFWFVIRGLLLLWIFYVVAFYYYYYDFFVVSRALPTSLPQSLPLPAPPFWRFALCVALTHNQISRRIFSLNNNWNEKHAQPKRSANQKGKRKKRKEKETAKKTSVAFIYFIPTLLPLCIRWFFFMFNFFISECLCVYIWVCVCVLIVFAFRVCSNSKLNCFQSVFKREGMRKRGGERRRATRSSLSSLVAFFVVVGRRLFSTDWVALFLSLPLPPLLPTVRSPTPSPLRSPAACSCFSCICWCSIIRRRRFLATLREKQCYPLGGFPR